MNWVDKYLPMLDGTDRALGEKLLKKMRKEVPAHVCDVMRDAMTYTGHIEVSCSCESAWFKSDGDGSPHLVAAFMCAFFHKFKLDKIDVLTWAEVSPDKEADGFGGGVMVASRDGYTVCGFERQYQMCIDMLAEMKPEQQDD